LNPQGIQVINALLQGVRVLDQPPQLNRKWTLKESIFVLVPEAGLEPARP
jgi:hypothetical protein